MQYVWVMSKAYQAPNGDPVPVAWSYGYNHSHMGFQANGWGLVWLTLDVHQLVFLKSGIDPNVQVVGIERNKPIPLLLETYADKLEGGGPYANLGEVLDKLGEWEPRFLLERSAREPSN